MEILKATNITKAFPGVIALDSVDVAFELGEIHCIVGENGAGKSTLIKCLTGVYEPEIGEIFIEGKNVSRDKKLFERVAYVPQEIDLFNHMSVAENLFIPFERSGINGIINQKELNEKAAPILKKFDINVAPETLVKDIPVSSQQLLQISRATIFEDYELLMLDEPTTSLTTGDAEILFDIIRKLKAENKAIVFISHKLEEVFEIGDKITVFRNGKNVAHSDLADVDIPWTITQMTGHALDEEEIYYSEKITDEVLLEVEHLTGDRFTDISFNLKKGEILGFSGLVGAGRSELMQAVFGYLPAYKGSVKYKGEPWKLGDSNYSVKNGMFYLPEERRSQGILPEMSVKDNISVTILDRLTKGLLISKKQEIADVTNVIQAYDVKTPSLSREIKFLSGGNQQKAIIGRSIYCGPEILIFDEPTKGIDVGTKVEIYRMMKKIAEDDGVGIILISSEMNELLKCCNRIITLYQGKKVGEHDRDSDHEDIMSAIFGLEDNVVTEVQA